jgi:hypothetical protein
MLAERQRAPDTEMKVGESDAGVVEDVVDLGGSYRHRLA